MTRIYHTADLRAHAEHADRYKARPLHHARTSLKREAGGFLRFDVHQNADDPALVLPSELYRDRASFEGHRSSEHLSEYRRGTDAWVAERMWWY